MNSIRIAVVGATGRMGRTLVQLIAKSEQFKLVGAAARGHTGHDAGTVAGTEPLGLAITSDIEGLAGTGADVFVDFSSPLWTVPVASAVVRGKAAWVNGTSGLDPVALKVLDDTSKVVPVLWEPNMSMGVVALGALLRQAISLLGPAYDIEIVESHHRRKVDAPSGTALKLAEIAQKARGGETNLVHGRLGRVGERRPTEIGVHAIRGGDVFGDHTVHLLGPGERLELTYRATGREVWAQGALRAALELVTKPAGLYRLSDLLQGAEDLG